MMDSLLVQLASLHEIDLYLTIAVFSFAISIPFLTASIILLDYESQFLYITNPIYKDLADLVGIGINFIGICAFFGHFSFLVGLIFIGASIFASLYVMKHIKVIVKLNEG